MTEPSAELLAETLVQTLEEAAFVFVEPQEQATPFAGKAFEARISYQGPTSGELRLVADASLAASLAANLLGEDEGEQTAARAGDAVGELANMLVGVWVVRLFGEECQAKLGIPQVRELSRAEASAPAAGDTCVSHLIEEEGRRIDFALATRAGGAAP